jgi:hypothetical protein
MAPSPPPGHVCRGHQVAFARHGTSSGFKPKDLRDFHRSPTCTETCVASPSIPSTPATSLRTPCSHSLQVKPTNDYKGNDYVDNTIMWNNDIYSFVHDFLWIFRSGDHSGGGLPALRSQRPDAETAGRTRDWRGLQAETVCGDTAPSINANCATRRTTPSVHSATSCLATTCVLSSSYITAGGAL